MPFPHNPDKFGGTEYMVRGRGYAKSQADFENIANRLLEEKSQKFTEQNRNNLDSILKPLQERIKEFEEKGD